MRRAALFCCVSLLAAGVRASQYADYRARIDAAQSEASFRSLLESADDAVLGDGLVAKAVESAVGQQDWRRARAQVSQALRVADTMSKPDQRPPVDPQATARDIVRSPVYRDTGEASSQSWITRSFRRIGEWLEDLLDNLKFEPKVGGAVGLPMAGLEILVWFLLVCGLGAFVVWFLVKFSWIRAGRARRSALLDEGTEVLSADEWLTEAAQLESQGRYREAVRCLYLAGLMRLDEANVLRFVRHETNWEHLARFERAPDRPQGIELRLVTLEFDRVWYGNQVRGVKDVEAMREHYSRILGLVRVRR